METTRRLLFAPDDPGPGSEAHVDPDCDRIDDDATGLTCDEASGGGLSPCPSCWPDEVILAGTNVSSRKAHLDAGCRYASDDYNRRRVGLVLAWGIDVCKECLAMEARR